MQPTLAEVLAAIMEESGNVEEALNNFVREIIVVAVNNTDKPVNEIVEIARAVVLAD